MITLSEEAFAYMLGAVALVVVFGIAFALYTAANPFGRCRKCGGKLRLKECVSALEGGKARRKAVLECEKCGRETVADERLVSE